MSYILTTQSYDEYLHVKIEGENTLRNVLGYLQEVHRLCVENRYDFVLIEEELTGPGLSLFQIFEIASEGSHGSPMLRRIAYIDVNPEHSEKDMGFAQLVANNRGMNVRIFPDVAQAREWLLS